ncbi:TolC family outer membrane protein [Sulfurimonas sp. NWX79]|uniref:TolC family outer membrane protein n=1 Tax=Sulfurimonas sp. NWX79 TaxID=2925412 RepID=UPI0032046DDB
MVKRVIIIGLFTLINIHTLTALTIKESVVEVMDTNPVVQERLRNYRATREDLNIANAEYLPSVDFRASLGYTKAGLLKGANSSWNHAVGDESYGNYESSLVLTQNLFDGFGTTYKVSYQEARILAAAYNYIEKANDIAYKMTNAYLNVLREYELLQTARENVQINEEIFKKVKDLYDSGLTTDSEVKKIESALSLARSNLTVQKNNTRDKEYNFRRVLGRMPHVAEMQKPDLNVSMPSSVERAAEYAINHNPSLLVSRYNIKGAQAIWKQHQKEFYPKIDLEVTQNFNDVQKTNAFDQPDDRFKARVVLSYNLFRGFADRATVQKDVSKINQEVETKRDLKRQVIEALDLSWNAYEMIALQLKDLRDYKVFAEKTLELYKEEYDLGRRSLLDLLTAQNDVINSRAQIIKAEYDYLLAKYRILDAMGLLPLAIIGDTKEFDARVNLYINSDADQVIDTLPVKYDVDNDKIADDEDLCDNSLLENNIMPYGCVKMTRDSDGDGIINSKDKCPNTPKNAKVSSDGCAVDVDMDGVKDYKDKCPNTPLGYNVNEDGCAISLNLGVNFAYYSDVIDKNSYANIEKFAEFAKKNKQYRIHIVGHTSSRGDTVLNKKLSKRRADSVKRALVKLGIAADRITTEGRGEEEPIADNETPEGRYINRRVEVELTLEDWR